MDNSGLGHLWEKIKGLVGGKADVGHSHVSADITDKDTTPTSGSGGLVTSGGVYTALSGKQAKVTGGASTITSSNLTANRALVSNASGKVVVSDVTSTELGYLDGVTSNVQTQLNGKASTSHTHTKANITDFPSSMKNPNALTLQINGTSYTYDGESRLVKAWYAPTTAGTAGYELVSSGSGAPVWKAPAYAVCSTSAYTAEKTASISNFKLVTGVAVKIKFTYANTVATPTLNISSTGAKKIVIYKNGSAYTLTKSQTWTVGVITELVYDGTYWVMQEAYQGSVNKEKTTVIIGTTASGHGLYEVDYLCQGVGDNSIFQEAVNSMSHGGIIHILRGDYTFDKPITIPQRDFIFEGEGGRTTEIYCHGHSFISNENDVKVEIRDISFYLVNTLTATKPFIYSKGDICMDNCRIIAETKAIAGATIGSYNSMADYIRVSGDVNIQNCDIDITRTFTANAEVCSSLLYDQGENAQINISGCNITFNNNVTATSSSISHLSLIRSGGSVTDSRLVFNGTSDYAKSRLSEGGGHVSNCVIDITNSYGDISKIVGYGDPESGGSFTNNTVYYANGCYVAYTQVIGNYFYDKGISGYLYFRGPSSIVIGNRFKNRAANTVLKHSDSGGDIIFAYNVLKYSCTVSSLSSAIVKDNIVGGVW